MLNLLPSCIFIYPDIYIPSGLLKPNAMFELYEPKELTYNRFPILPQFGRKIT